VVLWLRMPPRKYPVESVVCSVDGAVVRCLALSKELSGRRYRIRLFFIIKSFVFFKIFHDDLRFTFIRGGDGIV
jgi:hypothetical protein